MREVSCRILSLHFGLLQRRGLEPSEFFAGLSYPVEYLRVAENRIDWSCFVEIHRRLRKLCRTDAELVELGANLLGSPSMVLHYIVAKLIASPKQFYFWNQKLGYKILFSNLTSTLTDTGPNSLELVIEIDPGYEPCLEYFLISRGAIAMMPTIFGFAPSRVELQTDGRRGVFTIECDRTLTVWSRMRQLLSRMTGMRQAVGELERGHKLLQERYDALSTAKARLAEQAAHLEVVNEIGQLLSKELELERLAEAIVRVVRERVGAGAARLEVLRDGEVIFATGAAGQAETVTLVSLGRPVGTLLTDLRLRDGSPRASLLEALTPWFAAALENAISWRAKQESQAELERKVQERTRELTAAYDRLKAYDNARAEFFANVSHELRTPLSLILAPAEVVLSGGRGPVPEPVKV
ncbi:MAG: histidine kinase dimerization/phospho-acceptor domain-containing protein, partial [Myxococcales bacterium]